MPEDIAGGPGWVIRAMDLRPAITDAAAFASGIEGDPLAEPLALLWAGDPARALRLLELEPSTRRVRALRADCRRDLGQFDRAVVEYDALVNECTDTAQEAVMRQHRGKAYFASGDTVHAIEDFKRAVFLRQDGDRTLLASAQQALEVAEARQSTELGGSAR